MLRKLEVQLQLPIVIGLLHLYRLEQIFEGVLCQEGTSQYPHNIVCAPVELKCSFNDCNSAICNNCHINLNPYGIFTISPKAFDAQVTLHPFEENFHDPSIFIQKGYNFCFQIEVVCIVSESSSEYLVVINNSPDFRRIVFCVSLSVESHGLISKYIISTLQKIFSCQYFILWISFFPNNKERIDQLNAEEPFQIPVTTVKDITGKRLVIYPVHCIHIMNCRLCNVERNWNLGRYINLCVDLDARFGTSEPCPFKKRHTQIYSGGIKGIVFTIEFKFFINTFFLGKSHHVISEFFKNTIITELVHFGQLCSVDRCTTKTKMKGFPGVSSGNISKFTEAAASIQLTEHENQQLIPGGQTPLTCSVCIFIHNPFELPLRHICCYLTENELALIHVCLTFWFQSNLTFSKGRHGFRYD